MNLAGSGLADNIEFYKATHIASYLSEAELIAKGHKFESETDTEVCAHLVTDYLQHRMTPEEAVKAAVNFSTKDGHR